MIASREALAVGQRVSYEDQANPRREGEIVGTVDGGQYRIRWDPCGHVGACDCERETVSDLRQHGWFQLAGWDDGPFAGAEILYAYTRKQALEDGELVAVEETAKEAGFVWPVAVTRALWNLIDPNEREAGEAGQSAAGRLWDVCFLAFLAIKRASDGTRLDYDVIFYEADRGIRAGQRTRRLHLESGPGDNAEPVVTIGFPEDF